MVNIVNTINIPLDDLLEHFRGRGITTQRRLATMLERDPSDISNFLNRKARDSYADSVCSDIERIFGVVVTGYKAEEE